MGVVSAFAGGFKVHGLSGANTGNGEKSKIAKEKKTQTTQLSLAKKSYVKDWIFLY